MPIITDVIVSFSFLEEQNICFAKLQ
uniref:Uncharacterized protein n=1 Tax=Anguilla anguilla TaxID=7936 RepID=A0A0E9RCS1_ANGAN